MILKYGDKIAIDKRESKGVLSGMWELPNLDGNLTKQQILGWLAEQEIAVKDIEKMVHGKQSLKHIFTHIEWHMTCWIVTCENAEKNNRFTWVTERELENDIALPSAFKKVYQKSILT